MSSSSPAFDPSLPKPIARVIDLIEPSTQRVWNATVDEARERVARDDAAGVLALDGSFALIGRDGESVRMARSLDRPMRYFLAKEASGPMLIVAERIDEIRLCLEEHGFLDQFHPAYTRMVPAHHVTTLRLIGCPDPNPVHQRFFSPGRGDGPADLDTLGERYVGALLDVVGRWLDAQASGEETGGETEEPIGVLFSGGIDSGAVLLAVYHQLLARGGSPARLKAFTLAVDGGGEDARQAREFLRRVDLEMLGETIEVPHAAVDPLEAVAVIEDYKPLDVDCAAVALALLGGLRERYPDWRLLLDGDGGDENLKDYPIEENPELTIRSVVSNSMLYQEGWGVDAVKHSLTYSGGLSRGCVRTWAPARRFGFEATSPFKHPAVIEVAESIPFAELTGGDHEALYRLKGEVVRRGFERLLGVEFPVFPKRRFQHGALPEPLVAEHTASAGHRYRRHFLGLHAE